MEIKLILLIGNVIEFYQGQRILYRDVLATKWGEINYLMRTWLDNSAENLLRHICWMKHKNSKLRRRTKAGYETKIGYQKDSRNAWKCTKLNGHRCILGVLQKCFKCMLLVVI